MATIMAGAPSALDGSIAATVILSLFSRPWHNYIVPEPMPLRVSQHPRAVMQNLHLKN